MVSKYNPGMSIYCELVGHNDAIWSLNWNSQNNRLATASADGSVNIWHPALAEEYYSRADELTIDKENNQSKTFEQGKYFNLSPKFQSEDEENYLDTNRNRSDLENDDEAQITDEHEADRWMRWPQIKPISIIKESNAGKVDWGKNDLYITPNRCAWLNDHILVVAYSNGYIKLYDVSTEQTIQEIKPNQGSKVIQTYSHLNDDMTPKPRDLINDISVNDNDSSNSNDDNYNRNEHLKNLGSLKDRIRNKLKEITEKDTDILKRKDKFITNSSSYHQNNIEESNYFKWLAEYTASPHWKNRRSYVCFSSEWNRYCWWFCFWDRIFEECLSFPKWSMECRRSDAKCKT